MMSRSKMVLTMAGGRSRHLLRAAFALAALAAGLWAWTAGLTGPYHFDDYVTPLNDPASQSLAAWREYLPVTLRPATKLTYALEAEAGWSAEPAPRRVVSILLHALSAGVLFLLISLLAAQLNPQPERSGTATLVAGFLALLWFAHPVHADNVLLLSGRTAALSGMFLLAALLALDRARPWLAATLFVLACLSRETALSGLLPLAVLAASRPSASMRSTLREMAPALLGGALILAWLLTTPRYLHLAEYSFLGRPFWQSFASQVGAVPVGLSLLFNPSALSIDYGIPLPTRISNPLCLLGLGLYASAMVGIFVLRTRSRAAAVGLALWLAALLPTQSVVPKLDALTNRPLSLALAGVLLLAAPLLLAGWNGIPARRAAQASGRSATPGLNAPRLATAFGALALIVLLTSTTAGRTELFESELSLWQDAASKSRTNERPHLKLAQLLKGAGRDQEAWSAVRTAQAIDPFSPDVALFAKVYRVHEVVR